MLGLFPQVRQTPCPSSSEPSFPRRFKPALLRRVGCGAETHDVEVDEVVCERIVGVMCRPRVRGIGL